MKLIPKKFLCKYPLKTGSYVVGVLMCLILAACCIGAIVEVIQLKECRECGPNTWRNAYGLSITACLYCFMLLFINLWFLWGVKKGKVTVVLCWVAVTAFWLLHCGVLLIVLLCLYSSETNAIAWLIALVCAVVGYAILWYAFAVGYGYFFELKEVKRSATEAVG